MSQENWENVVVINFHSSDTTEHVIGTYSNSTGSFFNQLKLAYKKDADWSNARGYGMNLLQHFEKSSQIWRMENYIDKRADSNESFLHLNLALQFNARNCTGPFIF